MSKYLFVGGILGVLSSLAVMVLDAILGETPFAYSVIVFSVHSLSSIASFFFHAIFTFGVKIEFRSFPNHFLVCLGSSAITSALSSLINQMIFTVSNINITHSGTLSYVIASLMISILSYQASKSFVFKSQKTQP